MEEGPAAVAAALGIDDAQPVALDLQAPPVDALVAGLPGVQAAVAGAAGDMPLALLGECTLTPAVTAGLRAGHPDLVLVWLDAHGDLNTPETSPSGFLGGMPFAILLGWCHAPLRAAAGLDPPLPEARAALVGARDLDPGEQAAIDRSQLVVAADVAGALAAQPAALSTCTWTATCSTRPTPRASTSPPPAGGARSGSSPRWRPLPRPGGWSA